MNNNQIKKQFKIIVPPDWDKNKRGKFWEEIVEDLFKSKRYETLPNIKITSTEIDILAKDKDTKKEIIIECKFHKDPLAPRVLKDVLADATFYLVDCAYLVSTSALTPDAKGYLNDINEKNEKNPQKVAKIVFWGPEELADIWMDIKQIKLPSWGKLRTVKSATLLVLPNEIVWVLEELNSDGMPCKALIYPTFNDKIDIEQIKLLIAKNNLWEGLDIIEGTTVKNISNPNLDSGSEIDKEIITPIGVADSFDDYKRPCNPKYFVARQSLIDEFWKFAESVKDGETQTRIICFSGKSGVGKSSLVLKLKADCDRDNDKKNFYIYHVDVRSASGGLFVASAIKNAIQKAIDEKFIELQNHKVSIDSIEQPLFRSSSLQLVLEKLRSSQKTIIVFFDQFEELLRKESMFSVYEKFERLAREIDALKENIILGFCWKTGIKYSDKHNPYYLWHDLSSLRKEIVVEEYFNQQESSQLIRQFNKKSKINKPLENFIIRECPGYPWLLRLICSEIYNSNLSGTEVQKSSLSQTENNIIKKIFDKQLDGLSSKHQKCLEFIAKRQPIPTSELDNFFEESVIKHLEQKRLIFMSGINYTLYWDIFKEYYLEHEIPRIPIKYKPKNNVVSALEIFEEIRKNGQNGIDYNKEIRNKDVQENKGTLKNIREDLLNLGLIFYGENNLLIPKAELIDAGDQEIAEYLHGYLKNHILILELYKQIELGKLTITIYGFRDKIAQVYSLDKPKTIRDVTSRIRSWFLFSGLLEIGINNSIIRPIGVGKQKGKREECCKKEQLPKDDPPLLKLIK
ncbi:restriction endonuclease [Limnoraphis robusta Tam1]|uniref:restriction endonuclease n=1 Tax=Limnoraphis robusta TaxID=1118279 RepID=UPI002B20A60A|nr:restriction endonuclease [Limnoraphis robusta]MEA5537508.1 restriction endonuclease [Limnoraphis robusta Tam1]